MVGKEKFKSEENADGSVNGTQYNSGALIYGSVIGNPISQIDQETKDKRAELVMQIQTGIMAQKQAEKVGQTVHVLCDGIDEESGLYLCRTTGDAPEVDGNVCVSSEEPLYPGQFYDVLVDDSDLYDLYGTVAK